MGTVLQILCKRLRCRELRQAKDCAERQWRAMGIVSVSDTACRVSKYFNLGFRHVLIIVCRTNLTKILQDPFLFFA